MPYYDSEAIERARQVDLLTYLQTCEPQELVHVSGNVYCTKTMTACGIPTASGAGSPVESADTAPWTISLRSMAIRLWTRWKHHRKGGIKPPFVPAPKEEKPKHLLLPQAAPDTGLWWTTSKKEESTQG